MPELRRRGVALAAELLRASSQGDIDTLISAPEWNQALANRILRAADWPYVQYREILHAAWNGNRAAGTPRLRVIALRAAVASGGAPVGFDILGSPIAEMKLDAKSFYAAAHPLLRMVDFVDGYIWQKPVDDMSLVDLIPLEEYAPADASRAELRAEWQERREDLAHPERRPNRASLSEWRARCPQAALAAAAGLAPRESKTYIPGA